MINPAIAIPVGIVAFLMIVFVVGSFLVHDMPVKERHNAGVWLKDE